MVAPLPATLIGALVMRSSDIPSIVWVQNLVATGLGILFVTPLWLRGTKKTPSPTSIRWMAAGCVALLALTLTQPGVEGVQRWIPLGALSLHTGALVLPSLLVLFVSLGSRCAAIVGLSAAAILLAQPDAAQASAFAVGWITVSLHRRGASIAIATVGVSLAAVGATLRDDPLQPVSHVEGIVGLAGELGPIWQGAAVVSLALPPIALLARFRQPAIAALGLYLATTLAAAWLGHYPVPFMGHGVAPILGYYAALGVMLWIDTAGPSAAVADPWQSAAST